MFNRSTLSDYNIVFEDLIDHNNVMSYKYNYLLIRAK